MVAELRKTPEWEVVHADCLQFLRTLPDACVDAVLCDPPYGLSAQPDMAEVLTHWLRGDAYEHGSRGFMGKAWDSFVPGPEYWRECCRVLKPGGHLLAFAGTRTYDLMAVAVRLGGFEVRDMLSWLYSTGFPKSLDVSKAIDAAAGAEREVIGEHPNPAGNKAGGASLNMSAVGMPEKAFITAPATDAAKQWAGWGTSLKPAVEPIVLARKPLIGTVAQNVTTHSTGALNIDACRIEGRERTNYGLENATRTQGDVYGVPSVSADFDASKGRWPANVLFDEEAAALLDQMSGISKDGVATNRNRGERKASTINYANHDGVDHGYGGGGGASRFFYVAKSSRRERDFGCEHLPPHTGGEATDREDGSDGLNSPRAGAGRTGGARNFHSTVKPIRIMAYLARLICPPGGLVLDPFCGSGTTGMACALEGLSFLGVEREAEYAELARARVSAAHARLDELKKLVEK